MEEFGVEGDRSETVEESKESNHGLLKLVVGIGVSAIVGKVVDKAVDAFMDRRRDKTEDEPKNETE